MAYKDLEKKKATQKAYNEANKDKIKADNEAYYEASNEKRKAKY